MDKAALLSEFQSRVEEFERYQNFIDKAQSQASRFAPAVVEKVIRDNKEKCLGVVEQIIPLMGDIDTVIQELDADRQKVHDGRQTSQFALDELELRLTIGDLTEKEFEKEAANLKKSLGSIDGDVGEIDKELDGFKQLMDRWTKLGRRAGVLAEEPAPAPVVVSVAPPPVPAPAVVSVAPPPVPQPEPSVQAVAPQVASVEVPVPAAPAKGTAERAETLADDDLVVMDSDELDIGEIEEHPAEVPEKPRVTVDVSAAFAEDAVAVAVAEPDKSLQELDILGEPAEVPIESKPEAPPASDKPRRAVMLYQEGTAEEQIYPFANDTLTVGRGRDNDIQVKNDSKVSRYHCKLYRRGPNFYIEDCKSANGSLVNGELITERRLFGGEEIIIGETFFRFRILD